MKLTEKGTFFISANLIECRVQITFVYRGFLFLDSFLSKHQPDFYIRIRQPVDIFGLQISCLNTEKKIVFHFHLQNISLKVKSQVLCVF